MAMRADRLRIPSPSPFPAFNCFTMTMVKDIPSTREDSLIEMGALKRLEKAVFPYHVWIST